MKRRTSRKRKRTTSCVEEKNDSVDGPNTQSIAGQNQILLSLPCECQQHILLFLEPHEVFLQALVCRAWKDVAEDPILHAQLYRIYFSSSAVVQDPSEWKQKLIRGLQEASRFRRRRQLSRRLLWAATQGHDMLCERIFREADSEHWVEISVQVQMKALSQAITMGHVAVVAKILARKDDPTLFQGTSVLHLAAKAGAVEIMKLLLKHPAVRINEKNGSGAAPLFLATEQGHHKIVKLLLNHAADVRIQDSQNGTPLHIAAAKGDTKIASLLIDKGACVNAITKHGHTPLDYAQEEEHEDMVELLQAHGGRKGKKRRKAN